MTTIYTVVNRIEGDILPFVHSYTTLELAKAAVVEDAIDSGYGPTDFEWDQETDTLWVFGIKIPGEVCEYMVQATELV